MNYLRVVILALCFLSSTIPAYAQIASNSGELDLTDWSGENISLKGKWLFHWDQYFEEVTLLSDTTKSLIEVPMSWNNLHDSLKWRAYGKAVYQIKLKNIPDKQLALNLPYRICCSYRLFVDDELIANAGSTGNVQVYDPDMSNQLVSLPKGKKESTISIEIANYSQHQGGLLAALTLGELDNMIDQSWVDKIPELAMITAILVMALLSLNLYSLDRSQKLNLYISILSLISILHFLTVGEVLLKVFWPLAPYTLWEFLRHGGFIFSLAITARFLSTAFSGLLNQRLLLILEWLFYFLGASILFSPTWWNSYQSLIAQLLGVLMISYALMLMIYTYRKGTLSLNLLIAGVIIVLVAFIHDALVANMIITGRYLQPYGMGGFILCYSFYANTTSRNLKNRFQSLSQQLGELGVISDQKKELDTKVSTTLKNFRSSLGERDRKRADELINHINRHRTINSRQDILQKSIEDANEQFLEKLRKKFPNLTRNEEELCTLLRANLTTKEIAEIRKITVGSAKVARKRLRKKLQLTPDQDIYKFISSI